MTPHKAMRMRRKWYACARKGSPWLGFRVCREICEGRCPHSNNDRCECYMQALKTRRVK